MSNRISAFLGSVWGRTAVTAFTLALSMNYLSAHVISGLRPLSMNY